jgi:uncharacterized protein (DUF58 family)
MTEVGTTTGRLRTVGGVRDALGGLTLRGRAFVAAGCTAVLCAIVLGQSALTRVGVLVVALPLVAAVVIARGRTELTVTRSVAPRLVTAGQPARVDLAITSDGRRASGALLAEDLVPYALGTRSRFVLQGLSRRWERKVSYQVRSDVRGSFDIGPLVLRVADPFGLVELRRTFPGTSHLVVTPRTVPLPRIPLGGGWSGAGEHRPQAFAAGSAEDVSVREYRRGDELRRVHWRSSAKIGELMVRREEQPWEARATVLLDDRLRVHRGQGLASSFEAAVSVAASVVVHLEQLGYAVRLVTSAGAGPEDTDNASAELERLALVTPQQRSLLDVGWCGEQARGGVVVAVLGSMEPGDVPALRRIRHDSGAALAIVLDVEQWTTRVSAPDLPAPASGVNRLGWRAATVGPRDRLDDAWRDLGRSGSRAATGGVAR